MSELTASVTVFQATVLSGVLGLLFTFIGLVWCVLVNNSRLESKIATNLLWFLGFLTIIVGFYLVVTISAPTLV